LLLFSCVIMTGAAANRAPTCFSPARCSGERGMEQVKPAGRCAKKRIARRGILQALKKSNNCFNQTIVFDAPVAG